MALAMHRFLLSDAILAPAAREKLINWMIESPTGRQRLRAGLPADWRAGDKTGTSTGPHNATNDVAICFPPAKNGTARKPMLIACFMSDSQVDLAARNAAHADIARIIVDAWA